MTSPAHPPRLCILVMGPSGVGKTTFAQAFSRALDARFIEGDDYHTPENRAAMSAGRPLTDEMRMPWLSALAEAVRQSRVTRNTVFTCSALKRSYRDLLREGIGEMRLICLTAPRDLIRQRMVAREHFMPAELLDSQIEALELPTPEEQAIMLEMSEELDANIERALKLIAP